MQPDTQTWRTEPRRVYSIDFKLKLVEMAIQPDANIADIARAHGVNDNVLFGVDSGNGL
ncbi:transposase [Kosakonia cowanii]|uniref:transposase n=1 Tax=Kosakonia cowanii TaxID=208223 RepID=UPI00345BCBCC